MRGPQAATLCLLVDVQVAFCEAAGSMARQGRDIDAMARAAERCGALARHARAAGVPVVWTRLAWRPDYLDAGRIAWAQRPKLREIGALRHGTHDVEISSAAGVAAEDVVIDKPRWSALYASELEALLRALGTTRVVLGGVTTSMCVESTVRDLAQRDFEVVVVEEACGDFDRQRHHASLAAMRFGFAEVVPAFADASLFAAHA
jgi:ureidoacrylate peracid hydrolase